MSASVISSLTDVKKELKKWETSFFTCHERKPVKGDIEEAPQRIRDLYQKYNRLKRDTKSGEVQSQSNTTSNVNEDNTKIDWDKCRNESPESKLDNNYDQDDVWGKDCNKKKRSANPIKKDGAHQYSKISQEVQNIAQKIQAKSLSRSTWKSTLKSPHLHKPRVQASKEKENNANPKAKTIDNDVDDQQSDVTMTGIFQKSLKFIKTPKINSDKTPGKFVGGGAIFSSQHKPRSNVCSEWTDKYRDKEIMTPCEPHSPYYEEKTRVSHFKSKNGEDSANVQDELQMKTGKPTVKETIFKQTSRDVPFKNINDAFKDTSKEFKSSPWRPSTDNVNSFKDNDPFEFPMDMNSPAKASKRKRSSPDIASKPKRSRILPDFAESDHATMATDDDDKPDVVWDDGRKLDEDIEPVKPKKTSYNSSAPSARSSRAKPSENFVRLNMKAKRYKRKGSHMTGEKFKRQQWKEKMSLKSKSFGAGKCFKCGKEGHWANKCTGRGKISSNVGWQNEDATNADNTAQEEDFPSLKEAADMAAGIKYTPKNVKRKVQSKKVETSNAVETPDLDGDVSDFDGDLDDAEPIVHRSSFEKDPPPPPMRPYYEPDSSGNPDATPKEVYKVLKRWGYNTFRPGQEEAIMRILSGLSTLVVLSTGAGKSLCYQLPAFMYAQREKCITLVISPLVSLMEDQVTGLPHGVKGACLHTNMSKIQREKIIASVINGEVHFLLISPEALVGGGGGQGCFPSVEKLPPIAFACIDEAHCVSEWSHHFRPSYLRLCKVLKDRLGVQCFLGLTATATLVTAASVAQHLGIHDYKTATIRGKSVPDNLHLSVSRDSNKDDAVISLLKGDRFSKLESIIIYCTRREQTEKLATLIRTCMKTTKPLDLEALDELASGKRTAAKLAKGKPKKRDWDAECYHAGMTPSARRRVQNAFMSGKLKIVCATVAFGMGLDKSDVRAVIHYNMPKSFESYVQEIGRAGRDGEPAHCHVFLDPQGDEMNELKKHTYANTVDRSTVKKLVQILFNPCSCRKQKARLEKKQLEAQFDDGIDYAELEDPISLDTKTDDITSQSNDITPKADDIGASISNDKKQIENPVGNRLLSPVKPKRVCLGHERAIPVESTVMSLDMKEEGISTLLCYLELHNKRWLELKNTVYATCTIQCYGGPKQLQAIAKKCPPVAAAIARNMKEGISYKNTNRLEFNVIEIADSMGWDSGPVKKELKLLMWDFDKTGGRAPSKSGVITELSDLAFHFISPGDLTDDEYDEIVDFLHDRVTMQERNEIYQLKNLNDSLRKTSHKHYWECSDEVNQEKSCELKTILREYFERQPEIELGKISKLSFSREVEASSQHSILDQTVRCENDGQIRADVRAFIQVHGEEHKLTARCIARIFHGIDSPCFPSKVWGRVRRFWRCHLDTDFNMVLRLATQELVRMR